jgi:hypothetical protein
MNNFRLYVHNKKNFDSKLNSIFLSMFLLIYPVIIFGFIDFIASFSFSDVTHDEWRNNNFIIFPMILVTLLILLAAFFVSEFYLRVTGKHYMNNINNIYGYEVETQKLYSIVLKDKIITGGYISGSGIMEILINSSTAINNLIEINRARDLDRSKVDLYEFVEIKVLKEKKDSIVFIGKVLENTKNKKIKSKKYKVVEEYENFNELKKIILNMNTGGKVYE